MFTENEKKANELIAKIKNTFSNADKALEFKKARQTEYKNLVNSMKNASRDTSRALDIMKNNVDEENYIKIKQNQKRSKSEAGPAEAMQSLSRMKKNFKQSKASTPSLILPVKKDRSSINAMRDAELMRVNDELLGKVMPASKPLLIKSSSSMGSAPAMMMKPVDSMKKIKKLRDKAASTVIPSINPIDPNYVDNFINKQKNIVPASPWLVHVKKCMKENNYTFKEALKKCKDTYTKTVKTRKPKLTIAGKPYDEQYNKLINMKTIDL